MRRIERLKRLAREIAENNGHAMRLFYNEDQGSGVAYAEDECRFCGQMISMDVGPRRSQRPRIAGEPLMSRCRGRKG